MNNKDELIALIKYLIDHNTHHNEELTELLSSLTKVNQEASADVLKAINSFNDGNLFLKEALKKLNK